MWGLWQYVWGGGAPAPRPGGRIRLRLFYAPYDRGTRFLLEDWFSEVVDRCEKNARLSVETVDCAADPSDPPDEEVSALPAVVLSGPGLARATWEGAALEFGEIREALALALAQ